MNVVRIRRKPPLRKKLRRASVCMSEEIMLHIEQAARDNHRTVSQEIRLRLVRDLDKNK